jgi:hypothetical protein
MSGPANQTNETDYPHVSPFPLTSPFSRGAIDQMNQPSSRLIAQHRASSIARTACQDVGQSIIFMNKDVWTGVWLTHNLTHT